MQYALNTYVSHSFADNVEREQVSVDAPPTHGVFISILMFLTGSSE